MKKAVIFDMDGVIVDSEGVMFEVDTNFYKKLGIDYDEREIFNGIGRANYHRTMIYKGMVSPILSQEDFDREYEAYFNPELNPSIRRDHKSIRNPHIVELLQALKSNGYIMAVASSAVMEEIAEVVTECEIKDYFQVLVSGCDFAESKPNPEIYLHTLERLGVEADEAYVIEDSPNGITAAKRAGIATIAKRENRFPLDQSHADYFIDDLIEVLDILGIEQ